MIWVVLAIFLVGIGLIFGSPFLDFLAPNENIWLVDLTDQQNPNFLAKGAETLWYQWQSWGYITLSCLILIILGCIITAFTHLYVEQQLSENKRKLDEQTEALKRSKIEFEKDITKQIKQQFANERRSLNIMTQEALDTDECGRKLKIEAERLNKSTNNSHKAQNRETRSKLAQRDRLSEQKRLIAEFLPNSGWKFADDSPVTYASILKLAKNFNEQRMRK